MWQACVRLALGQEGLITLDQALSAGCSSDCFKGHVARDDIDRILPGVYRLAGTAESPRQKLRAATLWGGEGTAASHTSAAALVGLKGFTLSDLHTVTTKDPRRAPDWLNVHRLPAGRPGTRPLRGIPRPLRGSPSSTSAPWRRLRRSEAPSTRRCSLESSACLRCDGRWRPSDANATMAPPSCEACSLSETPATLPRRARERPCSTPSSKGRTCPPASASSRSGMASAGGGSITPGPIRVSALSSTGGRRMATERHYR